MQPPSPNPITLGFGYFPDYPLNGGKHIGVDYASSPDPYAYAPEDGKVVFYGDAGTCGNNLQIDGATGRVGFCHLETAYVATGDMVKRGQKVAKIGYTGYVVPAGSAGAHLHTVLLKDGQYVDIRNYINQPFSKEGGIMASKDVVDATVVQLGYNLIGVSNPDPSTWTSRINAGQTVEQFLQEMINSPQHKAMLSNSSSVTPIVLKSNTVYKTP